MERYEIALEKAKKSIHIADHMMSVTYKLVNDPKLMLPVLERVLSALTLAMATVLHYERLYKRIPPFQDNFESMFNTFKARCTRRYNINIEYITLITDVNSILTQHKQSPVEFRKDDKFVICSEDYRLKVISIDTIKKYIEKAKLFVKESENMVSIDGRAAA